MIKYSEYLQVEKLTDKQVPHMSVNLDTFNSHLLSKIIEDLFFLLQILSLIPEI